MLEQIAECRTVIFDKTGTLTYGEPTLTEQLIAPGFAQPNVQKVDEFMHISRRMRSIAL